MPSERGDPMRIDLSKCQRKSLTPGALAAHGTAGVLIEHESDDALLMKSVSAPKEIDPTRMRVLATINTDAIDHEDEVILASGVGLSIYQKNPVVLWNHAKEITVPIGQAESPDGELDLIRTETEILAATYFAQSFPFAVQIFALIDEKVIRATSIRVKPLVASIYVTPEGEQVVVTEESEMVEFSWTPIGVNPEALATGKSLLVPETVREAMSLQLDSAIGVLNRGSLGGEAILPEIKKSLLTMVPRPRGQLVNPFENSQGLEMKTLTAAELKTMTRDKIKGLDLEKFDDETKARIKAMSGEDDDQQRADTVEGDEATVDTNGKAEDLERADDMDAETGVKLGAKVLQEAFQALDYVVGYLNSALDPVENESVKGGMSEVLKSLSDHTDMIRGLYSESYPDMPELGSDQEKAEETVDDKIKSMLADSQTKRFQTLGLCSMIGTVCSKPGLPDGQRKSLLALQDKLRGMVKSATEYTPKPPEGYVPAERVQKLEQSFDSLLQKVEKHLLPTN